MPFDREEYIMVVDDPNVRSLAQILLLAKRIIDKGLEKEFLDGCKDNDACFVVGTEAARKYMADFSKTHHLDPNTAQAHGFSYGGSRCS